MRSSAVAALAFATAFAAAVPALAAQDEGCGQAPYDCALSSVERGEFAAAIRTLDQILASTPRDLKALNLLGIALTGAGRAGQGDARFREALRVDPNFYPALKNLAINEFNGGRLSDAERHLDEVLAHVPDDKIAHVHLAEILFERKDLRAALGHYEKARRRVASNPGWLLHYAACLL